MSDENTVVSADEAAKLPAGQWVADKGGTFWCLVDTHMGFPQRMAMSKGGRSYFDIESLGYPLHLADFDGDCEHKWGANEMGHCRRCGQVSHDPRRMTFSPSDLDVFRAVAELNARHTNQSDGSE